jgi:hypothetical protein
MDLHGRRYELTLASAPDGMALELDDVTGGGRETVALAFLADGDTTITFGAYRRDLPLAAVEWPAGEARRRLPPNGH